MKETRIKYGVGTLLNDGGKLGMILAYYPQGSQCRKVDRINWRANYHLYFASHKSYIIGAVAFERLVEQGTIKIIAKGVIKES